jgi:Flp pilus assembly protein CpaB
VLSTLRYRLPRLGRWPRLCAVGICLCLAAASALQSRHPRTSATAGTAVVVAWRDLPAGHTLGRDDVSVTRWPPGLRPAGARGDPAGLIGQRLSGPVHAREPLLDTRLVGATLARGLAAGTVAAPVQLDDPHATDVVHAGDRVTVLETPRLLGDAADALPKATVSRLADHVLVLAVLPARDVETGEVVLAVDAATAVQIARDRPTQVFTLLVDPP